jgi:hypothetical protein
MNAEAVEIEDLTLEQGLPAMMAAMQFANMPSHAKPSPRRLCHTMRSCAAWSAAWK